MEQQKWITPKQLEAMYGFSLSAQAKMRSQKRIPFSKTGNFIRYNITRINEWLESKEVA